MKLYFGREARFEYPKIKDFFGEHKKNIYLTILPSAGWTLRAFCLHAPASPVAHVIKVKPSKITNNELFCCLHVNMACYWPAKNRVFLKDSLQFTRWKAHRKMYRNVCVSTFFFAWEVGVSALGLNFIFRRWFGNSYIFRVEWFLPSLTSHCQNN